MKQEIKEIKNLFNSELTEKYDLKKLKEQKLKIGLDSFALGKLFLTCFDYFEENNLIFNNEILKNYLNKFNYIEKLRDLLDNCGNGNEWGSYYSKEKIKKITKENRKEMNLLIQVFFYVFGEEEIKDYTENEEDGI